MSHATPAPSLDDVLGALAEPTRRRVIDLLRVGPQRAGDMARALEMTPPALSRHLRVLRVRGLIEEQRDERDARVRMFRLRPKPFALLRGWLGEVEDFWREQLAAYREHAESPATHAEDEDVLGG